MRMEKCEIGRGPGFMSQWHTVLKKELLLLIPIWLISYGLFPEGKKALDELFENVQDKRNSTFHFESPWEFDTSSILGLY